MKQIDQGLSTSGTATAAAGPTGTGRSVRALAETLTGTLNSLDASAGMDDVGRLGLLRELEDLSRAIAGASVRVQVAFATSQVAAQAAAGVPARRRGLAVADDLAAARKTSPALGSRELTSAKALVAEMPLTLAALQTGVINVFQARIITETTTCLDPKDRAEVDQRLQSMLPGASTAEIGKAVRGLVYDLDPAGYVARARRAAEDRGVSCRPIPDVMALLSARLPATQAVAAFASLQSHARTARASGDPRSLQQLMADELFHRLTGRSVVDGIDVEIGLVMTDAALFDGAADSADLNGYGPIPAELARDLLRPPAGQDTTAALSTESTEPADDPGDNPGTSVPRPTTDPTPACPEGGRCTDPGCDRLHGSLPEPPTPTGAANLSSTTNRSSTANPTGTTNPTGTASPTGPATPTVSPTDEGARAAKAWVRRLYLDQVSGILTCRDPQRRLFTGAVRAFVIARDKTCRNPWCGAPIRDIDHRIPRAAGGLTTEDNAQGLCQRCNLARERDRQQPPALSDYRPPPPQLTTHLGTPPHDAIQPRLKPPPTATSDLGDRLSAGQTASTSEPRPRSVRRAG